MNKRKNKFTVYLSPKDITSIITMLILFVWCIFVAFYSYSHLSESQLKSVNTTISSVNTNQIGGPKGRKEWISLLSTDGQYFYFRTDDRGIHFDEAEKITDHLEGLSDKTITVYYTNHSSLRIFDIFVFMGINRGVAIEYNNEAVLTLESYNKACTDSFFACILLALFLLIWMLIELWFLKRYERRPKSRKQS